MRGICATPVQLLFLAIVSVLLIINNVVYDSWLLQRIRETTVLMFKPVTAKHFFLWEFAWLPNNFENY